jgi:phosphatidylcholine synthase
MNKRRQTAAWLVHLYTILGGIVATLGLFEAAKGNLRNAFLLILLSHLIDGTDGLLARKVRVKQALPNFDGSMVDNVVDVYSYLWIPVFIMWQENLLPHDAWLIIPIIATMYAYGQTDMKTDDNFFLGFPSLWEVIALYLYFFQPVAWVAVLMVLVPGILSFVPVKFLYPSKNKFLQKPSLILAAVWVLLWFYILVDDDADPSLIWISLFYPIYYTAASFYATYKFRQPPVAA